MLGVFPDATYEQAHVRSAGRPDHPLHRRCHGSAHADDEEFGEERLIEAAIANRACSAPALEARLAEACRDFTGGRFQDDATLIVVAVD